jgi:hypothetical protein
MFVQYVDRLIGRLIVRTTPLNCHSIFVHHHHNGLKGHSFQLHRSLALDYGGLRGLLWHTSSSGRRHLNNGLKHSVAITCIALLSRRTYPAVSYNRPVAYYYGPPFSRERHYGISCTLSITLYHAFSSRTKIYCSAN